MKRYLVTREIWDDEGETVLRVDEQVDGDAHDSVDDAIRSAVSMSRGRPLNECYVIESTDGHIITNTGRRVCNGVVG